MTTRTVHAAGGARFPDTSWGLVLSARDRASPNDAFAQLCRRYWMPIYVSLRRQGIAPADADDLVQGFFLSLFEDNAVARADPQRGRFRNFLLGALRRFLANEHEREHARKRGGAAQFVEFDTNAVEIQLSADESSTPLELLFDRQWARALLANAMDALREEYVRAGNSTVYAALESSLDPGAGAPDYAALAQRLQRNPGAIKVAVHRLRDRFREVLRREVGLTVASADDVDDELTHLRDVLAAEAAL
ncbi:MAG: sigma-70 family RNA polymerase sigma factor [Proteobacteria bacterium]|nr:sigma-70 family RNA polymerase sigma factor [Pseudomonadota bacterium]